MSEESGSSPAIERLGGTLFRNRGWLPAPVLAAQIALADPVGGGELAGGLALLCAGELLRIHAVGYIGNRSRTMGDEVTGLERRGPYRFTRNPLYVANIAIWCGFGLTHGWWWALWFGLLVVHYNLIIRFEEGNLSRELGEPYQRFLDEVGRWFPRSLKPSNNSFDGPPWSLRAALRSERTTLLVLLVAVALSFAL